MLMIVIEVEKIYYPKITKQYVKSALHCLRQEKLFLSGMIKQKCQRLEENYFVSVPHSHP